MGETETKRVKEVAELQRQFAKAVREASKTPEEQAAWLPVADLAGKLQRRTRLLAGLKRGG